MPQRFLRPGITDSEHWNKCSFEAQSFYIRLMTLVDDWGRFDGRVPILHGSCFALRPDIDLQHTAALRSEMQTNNLIEVYEIEGKEYVQMLRWHERTRGTKSKWPNPLSALNNGPVVIPLGPAALRSGPQEKDASIAIDHRPRSATIATTPSPSFPPTVPQGGLESVAHTVLFKNLPDQEKERLVQEAKVRTCKLVTFRGKDPTRAWSDDAMNYLISQLPVPEGEWEAIEWFHGLTPDDSIKELKNRRQSETTLWQFWPDEVTRSLGFRQKRDAVDALSYAKKEEPEAWREVMCWLYGDHIHLPDSFNTLGDDLRAKYRRSVDAFLARQKCDKDDTISHPAVAKLLICKRILDGKDPTLPWNEDAEEELTKLLPIPIAEIDDIAWFRSIPQNDDIPELRHRLDPITEVTLLWHWLDELHWARQYQINITQKGSPTENRSLKTCRNSFEKNTAQSVNYQHPFMT
jgi:hypothetical protein